MTSPTAEITVLTQDSYKDIIPSTEDSTSTIKKYYQESKVAANLLEKVKEKELTGVPIEEIDPDYFGKNTFVVITSNGWLHRYFMDKSLGIFDAFNPLRRFAIYYDTVFRDSQIHALFWMLIIFLPMNLLVSFSDSGSNSNFKFIISIIVCPFYVNELCLKLLSRGGFRNKLGALRDLWTWLDVSILFCELLGTIFSWRELVFFSWSLRPFKVIQYLKEPGLKSSIIFNSFLKFLKFVKKHVIPFLLLSIPTTLVFTLLGTNRSKMIRNVGLLKVKSFPLLNHTTGFRTEKLYSNPQLNSAEFGVSFIRSVGLLTQDSLDRQFTQDFQKEVFRNVIFYSASFLFGTFILGVFVYGTIAGFLVKETNKSTMDELLETWTPKIQMQGEPTYDILDFRILAILQKILFHWLFDDFIRIVLLCNIVVLCLDQYGLEEHGFLHKFMLFSHKYLERFYILEIILKMAALGPKQYFTNRKNTWDFFIVLPMFMRNLLLFITETCSDWSVNWCSISYEVKDFLYGSYQIPLPLFRNINWWPSIRFFSQIELFKLNYGFFFIIIIFGSSIPYLGLGLFREAFTKNLDKFYEQEVPRWNFIDYPHAWISVQRMLYGEWTETFLNCWVATNFGCICILFYMLAFSLGTILLMFVMLNMITRAMGLMANYEEFTNALENSKSLFNLPYILWKWLRRHFESLISLASKDSTVKNYSGQDSLKGIRKEIGRTLLNNEIGKFIAIFLIILFSSTLAMEINFRKEMDDEDLSIAVYVFEWIFVFFLYIMLILRYLASGSCWGCLKNKAFLLEFTLLLDEILSLLFYEYFEDNFLAQGVFRVRCFRLFLLANWCCVLQNILKTLLNQLKVLIVFLPSAFLVWIFFDIAFVSMLNGRFYKCLDPADHSIPESRLTKNKSDCLANNFSWINSPDNFDDSIQGFITLVKMATLEYSWLNVLYNAMDARELDMQPIKEVSLIRSWILVFLFYFSLFITVCVVCGMIAFTIVQKKGSAKPFRTDLQWKCYKNLKVQAQSSVPAKTMTAFKWFCFGLIILDFFSLAGMEYSKSKNVAFGFKILYYICTGLIALEISVEFFKRRLEYFYNIWGNMDLILLIWSIVDVIVAGGIVNPIPRIFRMMFLYKFLQFLNFPIICALKKFHLALKLVIPSLINLLFFLAILFNSFLLFGLSIFQEKNRYGHFNKFSSGFIIVFKATFLSGWSPIVNEMREGCFEKCLNSLYLYFLLYLGICLLIYMNMYAIVILEFASQFSVNPEKFFNPYTPGSRNLNTIEVEEVVVCVNENVEDEDAITPMVITSL